MKRLFLMGIYKIASSAILKDPAHGRLRELKVHLLNGRNLVMYNSQYDTLRNSTELARSFEIAHN